MTYKDLKNKKSAEKTCFKCGINSGIKKYKFFLAGNRTVYCCIACIQELGSALLAKEWLEGKVPFNFNLKKEVGITGSSSACPKTSLVKGGIK